MRPIRTGGPRIIRRRALRFSCSLRKINPGPCPRPTASCRATNACCLRRLLPRTLIASDAYCDGRLFMSDGPPIHGPRTELLYHFCRLQLPTVVLPPQTCERHLQRTFDLYRRKASGAADWDAYLDNLYPLDWFVASACLEGNPRAWDYLFAARAGRTDCLLLDALRARAARLY